LNTYIETFNNLARTQEGFNTSADIKPWIIAQENIDIDTDKVIQLIRSTLKKHYECTEQLIGECFGTVQIASEALLHNGIRHTVTIGNVLVNGKPYFNVSDESIMNDLNEGYIPNEPANAHAWITLENGCIVDMTILSSLAHHKLNKKPPKWIKSIYTSNETNSMKLSHIPYHLGPEYIIRVVNGPSDHAFVHAYNWMTAIDDMANT
jgi:hypothetical protein